MITARMYPCQLSLNELGKLEDMHAQGADPDDFTIRWSSLMERFRLCEDIVSAEANEDILAAVLECVIKGSSGSGTVEVIGTVLPGAGDA